MIPSSTPTLPADGSPRAERQRRGTFGSAMSRAVLTDVQTASYRTLFDAIAEQPALVPCLTEPHLDWLSEDGDEANAAAAACAHCPALEQCRDYVRTHRQDAGTWAGLTVDQRPARASATAKRSASTHCTRRHELTAENTYTDPKGNRRCRTCRRTGPKAPRVVETGKLPQGRSIEQEQQDSREHAQASENRTSQESRALQEGGESRSSPDRTLPLATVEIAGQAQHSVPTPWKSEEMR